MGGDEYPVNNPVPYSDSAKDLKKEGRFLIEQLNRLVNIFLNGIFDLKPENTARRIQNLIALLLVSGFLISLRSYPLILWAQQIRPIFQYLLDPDFADLYFGNPFANFFAFVYQAFTDPQTLQYLPVLLAPFFIALQYASIYLTDIFELEDTNIARKFIVQVALTGNNKTIRIKEGEISEENLQSPIYKIGGPGKVMVDIDSVALFEKADGTPHIIGPTADQPGEKATLEGFERLRHTIDLRDHHSEPLTVSSRSLDGIKISATDIKLVYSIFRDHNNQTPTRERPYQYTDDVIKNLAYGFASKVTDQFQPANSSSSPKLMELPNVLSLVRGELGSLMGRHRLTDYLANIGLPEFEKALERETIIAQQASKMNPPHEPSSPRTIPSPPEFIPRDKITDLFSEIEENFVRKCRERGVDLHWIGVGTWKTSVNVVPERHLTAWQLSIENRQRSSEEAIKKMEYESILQKMTTLIQDVPISAFHKAISEQKEHKKAMKTLLIAYRQQLIDAVEFMRAQGEAVPPIITDGIDYLDDMFGHFL